MNRRTMIIAGGITAGLIDRAASAHEATPGTGSNTERVARAYIERVWNEGDDAAIDDLIAERYVPAETSDAPGRDAFRARWQRGRGAFLAAVPDAKYTVDLVLSDDRYAAIRGTITGTTTGGEIYDHWYLSLLEIVDNQVLTEWALVS